MDQSRYAVVGWLLGAKRFSLFVCCKRLQQRGITHFIRYAGLRFLDSK